MNSYVYVWFCPIIGEPRYVGKGIGRRYQPKRRMRRRLNPLLRRFLDKHNGEVPVVIVRQDLTDEEASSIEIALIKTIGRRDLKTGPLLNMTDGGDGVGDYWKMPENKERITAYRRSRSDEFKKAAEDQWKDPEVRSKMISGLKASMTPEHRADISNWMKRAHTPERRAEVSKKMKEGWTPEKRAALAERNRHMDPERRARASERMKQYHAKCRLEIIDAARG